MSNPLITYTFLALIIVLSTAQDPPTPTFVPYLSPQSYRANNQYQINLTQQSDLRITVQLSAEQFNQVNTDATLSIFVIKDQTVVFYQKEKPFDPSSLVYQKQLPMLQSGLYTVQVTGFGEGGVAGIYTFSYSVDGGVEVVFPQKMAAPSNTFGLHSYEFRPEKTCNYQISLNPIFTPLFLSVLQQNYETFIGTSVPSAGNTPQGAYVLLQAGKIYTIGLSYFNFILPPPLYPDGLYPEQNIFINIDSSCLDEGEDPDYQLTFCIEDTTLSGYFNHQTKLCEGDVCDVNAWTDSDCYCTEENTMFPLLKSCCPPFSTGGTSACECDDGYIWNLQSTQCVLPCVDNTWTNAIQDLNGCQCKPQGESFFSMINSCCPANSQAGQQGCECDDGYLWNLDQTLCLSCPVNKQTTGNISSDQESCQCSKKKYIWNPQIWSCEKERKEKSTKSRSQKRKLRSEDTTSSDSSESSSIKP